LTYQAKITLKNELAPLVTTWGVTFLDLMAQGVHFHNLACDGAKGIQGGAQEAELTVSLCPDLFHLLREVYRLKQRLEDQAYRAIETAERARRAEAEALSPQRRQGRPLQVKVGRAAAEAEEKQAISLCDLFCWLCWEIRQALEPYTPAATLTSSQKARETVETAISLLKALGHSEVTKLAEKVRDHLEDLLAPLVWLEQTLAPWRQGLNSQMEATIVWAWQNRQALGLREAGEGFLSVLHPLVSAFWQALELFHRSSSLVESLHSWLRPYLQVHRGMPAWLLPLLQSFWDHHRFQRGKRQGRSPLALAGLDDS
jgi:hypothetical protein